MQLVEKQTGKRQDRLQVTGKIKQKKLVVATLSPSVLATDCSISFSFFISLVVNLNDAKGLNHPSGDIDILNGYETGKGNMEG